MATFLNAAFVGNFSVIFTFLLVYALTFGLMESAKHFGKVPSSRGLNAMIALAIAVIVTATPQAVAFINFLVPWFLIMALVIFFILFGMRMFAGDADFSNAVMNPVKGGARNWIIIIGVVIVIFGLGNAFGQDTLDKTTGGQSIDDVQNQGDNTGLDGGDYTADDFIDDTGVGNSGVEGSEVATDDFDTNLANTLFNPKVLGLILIMLVGVFAIFFLSD